MNVTSGELFLWSDGYQLQVRRMQAHCIFGQLIYVLNIYWNESLKPKSSKLPLSVGVICLCDNVNEKQTVRVLLYFRSLIGTWQYNPNLLGYKWRCTAINDHNWQLGNCPFLLLKRRNIEHKQLFVNFCVFESRFQPYKPTHSRLMYVVKLKSLND